MDKKKVQDSLNRSLSGLSENPYLARRVIAQVKGKTQEKRKRFLALVPAIIILLIISVPLASAIFPGLIQILKLQDNPAAMNIIESVNYEWETEYVTAKVREMMYDGHGVYMLVDVGAKNESVILLPETSSFRYGLKDKAGILDVNDNEPNETIAEYAERMGKKVVFFTTAIQSEDRSFQTHGILPNEGRKDDATWTEVLCFPAETEGSQIRVRVYTVVYDDPVAQSKLSSRDPKLPLLEPHSIMIPISAMKTIEPAAFDEHPVITEQFKPGYIGIQRASAYQTDIAQYVEINFDNLKKTAYSCLYVKTENESPSIGNHLHWYLCPKDSFAGYVSGFRYVMTSLGDEVLPDEFDISVVGEYMDGSREDLGSAHVVFHKSNVKAE